MTEREKMVAGQLYDPSDPELTRLRIRVRKLARLYNQTDEDAVREQNELLREMLPSSPHMPALQAPVQFDYGCNTSFGRNCTANFNFICLDVCPVTVGDDTLFGPNVTLATPLHPLLYQECNLQQRADGSWYNLEYGAPITVEANCWIAANVVVGAGSVIAAGSVVTRDAPARSLAAGVPCRVLRPITSKDAMRN